MGRKTSLALVAPLALVPLMAFGQVIVSEIMYNPAGSDDGREWVEAQNIGEASIDISGWRFFEGNANHKLLIVQGNTYLQPGGFAVLASNPSAFLLDFPGFAGTLFDSSFSLNNTSGETLALKDGKGVVVSEVNYKPVWGAGGDGNSLQLISGSWIASAPTPGKANVYLPPPVKVETAPSHAVVSSPKSAATTQTARSAKSPISSIDQKPDGPTAVAFAGATDTSPVPVSREGDSPLRWYVLLAILIALALAAFWLSNRKKETDDIDDFKIVDETE